MRHRIQFATLCVLCGQSTNAPSPVPTIDHAAEKQRQVIVDRESGHCLGHPTTVLPRNAS